MSSSVTGVPREVPTTRRFVISADRNTKPGIRASDSGVFEPAVADAFEQASSLGLSGAALGPLPSGCSSTDAGTIEAALWPRVADPQRPTERTDR
jgi:hypothetical protein